MNRLHKRLAALERPKDTKEGIKAKLYLICFSDWECKSINSEPPEYDELLELSFQHRKQTGETNAATVKEYEAELTRSLPETGSELLALVFDRSLARAEKEIPKYPRSEDDRH